MKKSSVKNSVPSPASVSVSVSSSDLCQFLNYGMSTLLELLEKEKNYPDGPIRSARLDYYNGRISSLHNLIYHLENLPDALEITL